MSSNFTTAVLEGSMVEEARLLGDEANILRSRPFDYGLSSDFLEKLETELDYESSEGG